MKSRFLFFKEKSYLLDKLKKDKRIWSFKEQVCLLFYFIIILESNVILDIKLWTNRIVGQISSSIALDSDDSSVRLASEVVWTFQCIKSSNSSVKSSGQTI